MTTERFAFRVSNQDVKYEYHPVENTYLVKCWLNGVSQPEKYISNEEAELTYNYCSSMWIDYTVEKI